MKRLVLVLLWLLAGFAPAFGEGSGEVVGVNGEAKVSVRPDQFTIWVKLDTEWDGSQAVWNDLKRDLERLYTTISEYGVTRDQFRIYDLDLDRRYGERTSRSVVQIVVQVSDSNGNLLDAIQRGTKARVIEFGYESSEAPTLHDKARALAVSNAMDQIAQLARSRGGRPGRVLSIDRELARSTVHADAGFRASAEGTLERQSVPLSTGMLHFRAKIFVEAELVFDK